MSPPVTLAVLLTSVNTTPFPHAYRIFLILLGVFLVEGLVVFHRIWGSLPADLDRIGSELNLVAYGVAVTLLIGIFLGVVLLPQFPSRNTGAFYMAVTLFWIFNLQAYGYNARFSNRLRSSAPLQDGINTVADLRHVLGSGQKSLLLIISWVLGLIPTVACFAAQIFWG